MCCGQSLPGHDMLHPACCCARHMTRQLTHPCCRAPVCAAAGEGLIEEAVQLALSNGWVKPLDHVVVLSRSQMDEFMVKVGGRDMRGQVGGDDLDPK